MDFLCTLFHKHLRSLFPSVVTASSSCTRSQHGYLFWRKIFEQLCKCVRGKCTIQYGNGSGGKMDSLRTDGMSAKSHLLWMQKERRFKTVSKPGRRQICFFFTPSAICCAGCSSWLFRRVDYFRQAITEAGWSVMSVYVMHLYLTVATLVAVHRVLSLCGDQYETLKRVMYVCSLLMNMEVQVMIWSLKEKRGYGSSREVRAVELHAPCARLLLRYSKAVRVKFVKHESNCIWKTQLLNGHPADTEASPQLEEIRTLSVAEDKIFHYHQGRRRTPGGRKLFSCNDYI